MSKNLGDVLFVPAAFIAAFGIHSTIASTGLTTLDMSSLLM